MLCYADLCYADLPTTFRLGAKDGVIENGAEGSPSLSFDRYRDCYQNGNPRTIQHETDIHLPVSERYDTQRMPAYSKPPNSGPGGRGSNALAPTIDFHRMALRQQRGQTSLPTSSRACSLSISRQRQRMIGVPTVDQELWAALRSQPPAFLAFLGEPTACRKTLRIPASALRQSWPRRDGRNAVLLAGAHRSR